MRIATWPCAALLLPAVACSALDHGAESDREGELGAVEAPADLRDRVGIYNWNLDDSSFASSPGCEDRLNWGACKVAELGARTIRVYLGSAPDIYQLYGGSPPATLAGVAMSAPYAALFSKPFSTYFLTVYTADDYADAWQSGYTDPAVRQAEHDQIAELAEYLALTYPGKTFVLLNWEGDNAVRKFNTQAAWDGFAAWIQTRADGVATARARVLANHGFSPPVFSGLEFNAARSLDDPTQPCSNDPASLVHRCVVSYVGPRVAVDHASYSSWQSNVAPDGRLLDETQIGSQLAADLDAIGAALGGMSRDRIVVGEFGVARQWYPDEGPLGCGAARRSAALTGALVAWGAGYGLYWQILDNAPSTGTDDFGIFDAAGQPTATRDVFASLYATQTPTVPGYCPP
jgi:hypothetical protein